MNHRQPSIAFVRLTEIPIQEILGLLNEPRNARHMPLAGTLTQEEAEGWVRAKDAQWEEHGYGPWAVLVGREFAGWCGFQSEEDAADFALVLLPAQWGLGADIAKAALNKGFDELGLDVVTIALPFTRSPTKVVARFGFVPDGEITYGSAAFRRYRLAREDWRSAR